MNVHQMSGIGLESAQIEKLRRVKQFGKFHRVLAGPDAGSVKADIEIDEHLQHASGFRGARGQRARIFRAVDNDHEIGNARIERHQPLHALRRHDGRCDENALDAALRHGFRFTEFRAADAERARLYLRLGDGHGFMGLRMGPEIEAIHLAVFGHARHVALEGVKVEHQRGSGNLRPRTGHADQRPCRFHCFTRHCRFPLGHSTGAASYIPAPNAQMPRFALASTS